MIYFIRHAKPIVTDDHHSLWAIADIKHHVPFSFDRFICSTLLRSKMTGQAIFPNVQFEEIKLFDEIEKPEESQKQFKQRVESALSMIDKRQRTFVANHNRFMLTVAHIHGISVIGFDYLESLIIGENRLTVINRIGERHMKPEEMYDLPGRDQPVLCADGRFAMLICFPRNGDLMAGVQVHGEEDIRWISCEELTATNDGAIRQTGSPRMPIIGGSDLVQSLLLADWINRGGLS